MTLLTVAATVDACAASNGTFLASNRDDPGSDVPVEATSDPQDVSIASAGSVEAAVAGQAAANGES